MRVSGTLWWTVFALACAVNLYAVFAPSQPGPDVTVLDADKVAHLVLFGAVAWTGRKVGLPAVLLAVLLVVDAVGSELTQAFVLPHRTGDPYDVVADLAGVALGLAVARWTVGRTRHHRGPGRSLAPGDVPGAPGTSRPPAGGRPMHRGRCPGARS